MNRIIATLTTLGAAAFVAGCDGTSDANNLVGTTHYASYDPGSLAAEGNTQHHFQDPNTGEHGITDPIVVHADDSTIGSPEVVARLHACGKIPYASLGSILATRGVDITNNGKAGKIYTSGASALGIANYAGRVPEMVIASTSSMAKMFDVFVAASPEIQNNLTNSSACPGTVIADVTGKFSKDGISCILGRAATDDHVTLANQAVTQAVQGGSDVNTGVQIAIAALLEAAHSCE